jgi:hypothetical protein
MTGWHKYVHRLEMLSFAHACLLREGGTWNIELEKQHCPFCRRAGDGDLADPGIGVVDSVGASNRALTRRAAIRPIPVFGA